MKQDTRQPLHMNKQIKQEPNLHPYQQQFQPQPVMRAQTPNQNHGQIIKSPQMEAQFSQNKISPKKSPSTTHPMHRQIIQEAIKIQAETNKHKDTMIKKGPVKAGPVFGTSQFRVAPGAGPLPGLSHLKEELPKLGTMKQERERNFQQGHQRIFYQNPQQNPRQQMYIVSPTMTAPPRSQPQFHRTGPQYHAINVPPQSNQSISARKPWDLDLQPPKRQSGIEIVGRPRDRQPGIQVRVTTSFFYHNNPTM